MAGTTSASKYLANKFTIILQGDGRRLHLVQGDVRIRDYAAPQFRLISNELGRIGRPAAHRFKAKLVADFRLLQSFGDIAIDFFRNGRGHPRRSGDGEPGYRAKAGNSAFGDS
ncbi:MAG: hypothetical protein WB495_06800, partial [Xanthobacteraceae bacterium]